MARIVIEERCPPGCTSAGCTVDHYRRRVLDPGSFVLIERNEEEEWPDRTVVAVLDAIRNGDEWGEGWEAWDMARTVLDALAGGEQP